MAVTLTFLLISCLFFITFAQNPDCVKKCDEKWGNLTKSAFCDINMNSVRVPMDYEADWCYYGCNVTVLYPGTCKCPNFCYESIGYGQCRESGCTCRPGHSGRDCSITSATVPNLNLPPLPFGSLFPSPYVDEDRYKDHHPVFDPTGLATISLDIVDSRWMWAVHPQNIWESIFVQGNMTFVNNKINETRSNVGIRVKGNAGRMNRKKAWKFDFLKFNKPTDLFYGLKRLSLKGQQESLTGATSFIATELVRSLGLPHQRGSFARLYINGINLGIYWLHEEIEEQFFVSRYKQPLGGLYKCGSGAANLTYLGDKESTYRKLNITMGPYFTWIYGKAMGKKKDFARFVELVTIINKTSDADFSREISRVFNVDRYLRTIIHEVMFMNWDCYSIWNNNFFLYEDWASKKMEFIMHDYDLGFFNENMTKVDIFKWYGFTPFPQFPWPARPAPLTQRIQESPQFRADYVRYFRFYLDRVYNPSVLIPRLRAIRDGLYPFVKLDNMYHLDCLVGFAACPRNTSTWYSQFDQISKLITLRWRSALAQLGTR